MDPLSIIAGAIAISEAIKRLAQLMNKVRHCFQAADGVDALKADLDRLEFIINATATSLPSATTAFATQVAVIISDCQQVLHNLEALIIQAQNVSPTITGRARIPLVRMNLMTKEGKLKALKTRLRDLLFTLLLLLVLEQRLDVPHRLTLMAIEQSRPQDSITPPQRSILEIGEGAQAIRNPNLNFPNGYTLRRWRFSPSRGDFGSLIISHLTYSDQSSQEDKQECQKSKTAIIYYSPRWLSSTFASLSVTITGRIQFELSFPRIRPPDAPFFMAIRAGNVSEMKRLIFEGEASPADIASPYGLSTADIAMIHNQREACELLMTEGIAPFAKPFSHWAQSDVLDFFAWCNLITCAMGPGDVVDDISRVLNQDWQSRTLEYCKRHAILYALKLSRVHKIVLGLSYESFKSVPITELRNIINEVDCFGRTALSWAAAVKRSDLVKILTTHGANAHIGDFNGSTPLHVAAGVGDCDSLSELLAVGANIEARDRFGYTVLGYASSAGRLDAIDFLLSRGANIEARNNSGETALVWTNHGDKASVAQHLVSRGASVKNTDIWGFTPLLDSILCSRVESAKFLLRQEWDRSWRVLNGKTILHVAASSSTKETLKLFIEADLTGLDPFGLDDSGLAPLDYISQRPNAEELLSVWEAIMTNFRGGNENSVPRSCASLKEEDEIFYDSLDIL